MLTQKNLLPYAWLIIALLAYSLPWQWHPTNALTLNAYDLSEWQSVLASSQDSTIAGLASLSLRLPLSVLTVVFAFLTRHTAHKPFVIVRWLVILLLVVAQLPPLTALTNIFRDANNLQQFLLAGLSLILAGIIGLRRFTREKWLILGLVVVAVVASLFGITQALAAFHNLGITVSIGAGGIVLVGVIWSYLLIERADLA